MSPTDYCPHQPACPGCPLSGLPHAEQLAYKRERARSELGHYPALRALSSSVRNTVAAQDNTGYRVRAKLACNSGALGLYTSDHHSVVDSPECRILSPRVARVVQAVRALLPLSFELLALDVREADEGVLVTWIVEPAWERSRLRLDAERLMSSEPLVKGVSVSERERTSPRLLGSSPQPLLGAFELPHRFTPAEPYQIAVPGGFVQAHPAQAAALYQHVAEVLRTHFGSLAGLSVLELYAGAGSLALELAQRGAAVTATDSYAPSIERLARAAHAQGLEVEAYALSAEASLARTAGHRAVIVDPPRRGLSPEVRRALAASSLELLVVVSCEPVTLSRDLSHLRSLGFEAIDAMPFDLIPQSESVETVVVLRRGAPPLPVVRYQDEQVLCVDKPPFIAMERGPKSAEGLLDWVRLMPGWERAVTLLGLPADSSGLCVFARSPQSHAELSAWHGERPRRQPIERYYQVLAQGITHKRGKIRGRAARHAGEGAPPRYQRERVVSTHSLVQACPTRDADLFTHFASIGHPILGDARRGNPGANHHFRERHGLERPFAHCASVVLHHRTEPIEVTAELAPDLAAVLRSLEAQVPAVDSHQ